MLTGAGGPEVYSCEKVDGFLLDYVEGRLDPETARRFEDHIELCPNCERYLEQYRETIRLVKALPPPPVPEELARRTRTFIDQSLGEEPE